MSDTDPVLALAIDTVTRKTDFPIPRSRRTLAEGVIALTAEVERLRASNAELVEALSQCAAVVAGESMSKSGLVRALELARAALTRATKESDRG